MDMFSQIESTNRRRWHLITGWIICTVIYALTLLIVSAYIL